MSGNPVNCHCASPYLKITTVTTHGEPTRAQLRLVGEIDMAANDMLSACIDWLITQGPGTVVIDLAGVTFASSTLPNFVDRAFRALPADIELIICGADPMTQWILQTTDIAHFATISYTGPSNP